jgi:hypothetical protein
MQGTLLLTILKIRSSYIDAIELPLATPNLVPDTLQWWVGPATAWRIRTYAIDHDIHVHEVAGHRGDIIALAKESNRKHYADIIEAEHLLTFVNCQDQAEVEAECRRIGIAPRLEVSVGRFAFWKPDDARYSTKSAPRR